MFRSDPEDLETEFLESEILEPEALETEVLDAARIEIAIRDKDGSGRDTTNRMAHSL